MNIKQYPSQTPCQILKRNPRLISLSKRAERLNTLNHTLQKMLPLSLSSYCHLANYSSNKLIVYTANANFASLLRFQASTICHQLSLSSGMNFTRLSVKVSVPPITKTIKPTRRATLPSHAAKFITHIATHMDNNVTLSDALLRLAKRE